MNKLKQTYNQIKEKIDKNLVECVNFSKKGIKKILNIDENFIKNGLLLVVVLFLGGFSFCAVESSNNSVKSVAVDITPIKINRNFDLEKKIRGETAGYPIEAMTKYIAREDDQVAAFIVAIAKKESNWGKRTPKLKGQECYNYWGFRQKREKMGSGGHTCFDNPRDAVNSIAERVKDLIAKDFDTPEKMVVWKCGYSCEAQNPQSVQKWIKDVNFYYDKF